MVTGKWTFNTCAITRNTCLVLCQRTRMISFSGAVLVSWAGCCFFCWKGIKATDESNPWLQTSSNNAPQTFQHVWLQLTVHQTMKLFPKLQWTWSWFHPICSWREDGRLWQMAHVSFSPQTDLLARRWVCRQCCFTVLELFRDAWSDVRQNYVSSSQQFPWNVQTSVSPSVWMRRVDKQLDSCKYLDCDFRGM